MNRPVGVLKAGFNTSFRIPPTLKKTEAHSGWRKKFAAPA
jgi:hypothetical protein